MHSAKNITTQASSESSTTCSTDMSELKTQVNVDTYIIPATTTMAPTTIEGTMPSVVEQVATETAQVVAPSLEQVPTDTTQEEEEVPSIANTSTTTTTATQAPRKKARLTAMDSASTAASVSSVASTSSATAAAPDASTEEQQQQQEKPTPKRRVPRTRNLRHKFKPAMEDLKPPPFVKSEVVVGEVYVIKGKAKAWDGRQWRKICMTALCGRYAVLSDHCKTHGGGIRCAFTIKFTKADAAAADAAAVAADASYSEPTTPATATIDADTSPSLTSQKLCSDSIAAVSSTSTSTDVASASASGTASAAASTGETAPGDDVMMTHTCERSAVDGSKFCKTHGGGRRCIGDNRQCGKSAAGNTDFCKAHGGGNRCIFDGCSKSAVSPTDLCINHGGGKRCWFVHPPTHRSCLTDSERTGEVPVAVVPPVERTCGKSARGSTGFCGDHIHNGQCAAPLCTRLQKLPDAKYCGRHADMDGHPGGFANKAHRAALREIRRNHTGLPFMPRAVVCGAAVFARG